MKFKWIVYDYVCSFCVAKHLYKYYVSNPPPDRQTDRQTGQYGQSQWDRFTDERRTGKDGQRLTRPGTDRKDKTDRTDRIVTEEQQGQNGQVPERKQA